MRYSVLISARDEGAALRRTVDSVLLHAPDARFEILVVDDASRDGSAEFLGSADYSRSPIVRHRNESAQGVIASRALAADRARGDYLCVLDAHCTVPPGWLDGLAEALAGIDNRGIAVPAIASLDPGTWSIDESFRTSTGCTVINPLLDFGWSPTWEIEGATCTCTIGGGVWMCHRDWYRHIGGLDREMVRWGGENIDLPLRTWLAGGLCRVVDGLRIGHLFKDTGRGAPPPTDAAGLAYNKVRAAHTVFSKETFERVLGNLSYLPGFGEAIERLRRSPDGAGYLKGHFEAVRERSDDWLIETFELPVFEAPYLYRSPRRKSVGGVSPRHRRPRVTVVVTSSREKERLRELAHDLVSRTSYRRLDVLLLCSGLRGSLELLDDGELRETTRVRALQSTVPLRGGVGHNIAVLQSEAEYVIFLRDDAVILNEHWIEDFLLLFDRRPQLLLAAPRIRTVAADRTVTSASEDLFDLVAGEDDSGSCRPRTGGPFSEDPYQAFAVPDVCFAVHRERFIELGGLDRTVTFGSPPLVDLAIHGWLSGYEVFCDPEIHVGRRASDSGRHGADHDDDALRPAQRDYVRVLPAIKYFTNETRRESCRRRRAEAAQLLEKHEVYLARRRRTFLDYAPFDDDWLFYKFGVEESSR